MRTKLLILTIWLLASIPAFAGTWDAAWVRIYNGPANKADYASVVLVDDSGYVYVTGGSEDANLQSDYLTIKYHPNGGTVWVRRYDGPPSSHGPAWDSDSPSGMAVDDSGYVYVTGGINCWPKMACVYDWGTIKYSKFGDSLWARTYNGLFDSDDKANAIAVDRLGNVYVTGYYSVEGGSRDYLTIKYDRNGNVMWERTYNGPGNGNDQARAIAVDDSGYAYVTGYAFIGIGTYDDDYVTIKYEPDGDTVWLRNYDGPVHGGDQANALFVDDDGNLYVTGSSYGGSGTALDCATIKYLPNGNVAPGWPQRYAGSLGDEAHDIAVDALGNVYLTGESRNSHGANYLTVKYNSTGNELWARTYDGPGVDPYNDNDIARAIDLDSLGNVYVTGEVYVGGTSWHDYGTISYDPDGSERFVKLYSRFADSDDHATDIAVGDSSSVYVTGGSYSSSSGTDNDYATIKYLQRFCNPTGQSVAIRTATNRLNVQANSRVGVQENGKRFSYFADGSNYLCDGSLILGNSANKLSWQIFEGSVGPTPSNPFSYLYALTNIDYDSTTFPSYRIASGKGCNRDSTIGFDVQWYAPKHIDSADFYVGHFAIYKGPNNPTGTVSNLTIAYAADWDIPSAHPWRNTAGFVDSLRLIYQRGTDSDTNRYGGIAAFRDDNQPMYGGFTWDNDTHVYPLGGFQVDSVWNWFNVIMADTSHRYRPLPVDSIEDQSIVLMIGKNLTIGPTDTLSFSVVFAGQLSGSLAGLQNVVVKAKKFILDHVTPSGPCKCGDANGDGGWDISDAVFLIAYIFGGGPAPDPLCLGDANGDGGVDISDAVYLVAYIFGGGPEPICP